MDEKKDLQILKAARARFAHYGYSKTTMAEIASDCGMSVGNLYRFFENKEDIAVAGARTCLLEKAEVSETAAGEVVDAMDQLRAYMLARLRYMHAFISESPHMHELVELISSKHADLLSGFEERSIVCLANILERGMESGLFRRGESRALAADVYRATVKFNMPFCMGAPLKELEAELESLLELIHVGLRA